MNHKKREEESHKRTISQKQGTKCHTNLPLISNDFKLKCIELLNQKTEKLNE